MTRVSGVETPEEADVFRRAKALRFHHNAEPFGCAQDKSARF